MTSKSQVIRNYVQMAPKSAFTAVMVADYTGIPLRTVRNRLSELCTQGVIRLSDCKDQGKCLYVKVDVIPDYKKKKVSEELCERIVEILGENPGISQIGIAKKLGVTRQAVSAGCKQLGIEWHRKRVWEADPILAAYILCQVEEKGNATRYELHKELRGNVSYQELGLYLGYLVKSKLVKYEGTAYRVQGRAEGNREQGVGSSPEQNDPEVSCTQEGNLKDATTGGENV
jgi:hypothetical protein